MNNVFIIDILDQIIFIYDIKLTSNLCYWWYVCDGFLLNDCVYLCTEFFDKKDLNILKKN